MLCNKRKKKNEDMQGNMLKRERVCVCGESALQRGIMFVCFSYENVERANQAKAQNHGTPKTDIIERLAAPDPFGPLHHDNRQLQHLTNEAIAANLLCDARHDNLVPDGGDEEGDEGGKGLARVRARGAVDVAPQEGVDGDVPLARKLHPVGRVPPVGVEVAVGEAGDFGKGAEDVLEDDEEDEQKGEHEGKEQPGDCLGEDEA